MHHMFAALHSTVVQHLYKAVACRYKIDKVYFSLKVATVLLLLLRQVFAGRRIAHKTCAPSLAAAANTLNVDCRHFACFILSLRLHANVDCKQFHMDLKLFRGYLVLVVRGVIFGVQLRLVWAYFAANQPRSGTKYK